MRLAGSLLSLVLLTVGLLSCKQAEAGAKLVTVSATAEECSGSLATITKTKTINDFSKPFVVCVGEVGDTSVDCSWGMDDDIDDYKKGTKSPERIKMTGELKNNGDSYYWQFYGEGRIFIALAPKSGGEPGPALLSSTGFASNKKAGVFIHSRTCRGFSAHK